MHALSNDYMYLPRIWTSPVCAPSCHGLEVGIIKRAKNFHSCVSCSIAVHCDCTETSYSIVCILSEVARGSTVPSELERMICCHSASNQRHESLQQSATLFLHKYPAPGRLRRSGVAFSWPFSRPNVSWGGPVLRLEAGPTSLAFHPVISSAAVLPD
jgi:hypothetical protein